MKHVRKFRRSRATTSADSNLASKSKSHEIEKRSNKILSALSVHFQKYHPSVKLIDMEIIPGVKLSYDPSLNNEGNNNERTS